MCTVVILRRPRHDWPVIIGANRDEMMDRPWLPPGRHWADRADVIAGLDRLAGGSWMGLNDSGVVACILNRTGSLGPSQGKRSRGELVLEALDHPDAASAAEALAYLDAEGYRTFNLLIADNRDAFVMSHRDPTGSLPPDIAPVPEGISILTAHDLNDPASPRAQAFRPRFEQAAPPDPDLDDWSAWEELLSIRAAAGDDPREGMTMTLSNGFGTTSSSLLALPAVDRLGTPPVWKFAAAAPGEAPWRRVAPI